LPVKITRKRKQINSRRNTKDEGGFIIKFKRVAYLNYPVLKFGKIEDTLPREVVDV